MPLTPDKAEALLVMMWLLLPIMPRCGPGRKTARCAHCVPNVALYEAFLTRGTSFAELKYDFMLCKR